MRLRARDFQGNGKLWQHVAQIRGKALTNQEHYRTVNPPTHGESACPSKFIVPANDLINESLAAIGLYRHLLETQAVSSNQPLGTLLLPL